MNDQPQPQSQPQKASPDQQPAPQQQVVYVKGGNGMAVAALTCGIVGSVLGLIPILGVVALILGVLAVIFGFAGRNRAAKNPEVGRKTMATWGIVVGVLAVALGIIGIVIVSNAFDDLESGMLVLEGWR